MKAKILFISLTLIGLLYVNLIAAEDELRDLPSFSEIALSVPGKLHLKQGKKQSVKIVAQSSTLEKMITEVKGDKLVIRFSSRNYFWNSFKPGKIEIYVTIPEVEGLSVSGSGNISAEDKIMTDKMSLAISGSGSIVFENLDAKRVKAAVSGSGDIVINAGGIAENLDASISGSGSVKAGGIKVKEVNVKIAGSGNCRVNANDELNVRIAGSGNVYYSGNPNLDTSVSGSGRVKKM